MTEPRFGEAFRAVGEYDTRINTPSKSPAYYDSFHAPVIKEAKIHSSDGKATVLGIACGPGNEFEFMKEDPDIRLIGFDIDPGLIQQAKNKFADTTAESVFFVGDTRRPPFQKEIADVAVAVNALIYNPSELLDAAQHGLKPGGKLVANARIFGNEHNKPFYDTQLERGAILEDEEIDVNGEKFNLKIVNYATHKLLPQLGRQAYFTSEEDIERFMAAKGFIIDKHDKFHFASPDNPDNEVEVYTLQKPELKNIEISTMYRKSGDDLILFLHGLGCVKESFEGAWEAPELNDYSLLAPDFVGYGDSSRPGYFSYTMEDQARRIMAELEKYPDHKKVNIVAHSMGGAPGLLLADMLGDRLGAFINVEGSLNAGGAASVRTAAAPFKEFDEKIFGEIKHDLAQSPEAGWKQWVEWMQKADPRAFYRSSKSLVDLINSGELVERFNRLKAKKAYIYGERSTPRMAPVFEAIPDIQKIAIPNAEHFVMTDNPGGFYTQLTQILAQD